MVHPCPTPPATAATAPTPTSPFSPGRGRGNAARHSPEGSEALGYRRGVTVCSSYVHRAPPVAAVSWLPLDGCCFFSWRLWDCRMVVVTSWWLLGGCWYFGRTHWQSPGVWPPCAPGLSWFVWRRGQPLGGGGGAVGEQHWYHCCWVSGVLDPGVQRCERADPVGQRARGPGRSRAPGPPQCGREHAAAVAAVLRRGPCSMFPPSPLPDLLWRPGSDPSRPNLKRGRTLSLRHLPRAFWATCRTVAYCSLCVVDLNTEAHVTSIEVVVAC